MDIINSLLRTSEPKVLKYSPTFLKNTDPVTWAANFCRKNATEGLRLQAMKSAVEVGRKVDDSVYNVNPADPRVVEEVLNVIVQGRYGHANMELLHYDSAYQVSRFAPGLHFYFTAFHEALEQLYPHGHYAKANLWFSASQHVYGAHVDMADGFLFQLAGKKHVKIWPVPDEYANEVIYDHSDLKLRQSLPYREFTLTSGEMLFIPGSAVHEVTVDSGYSSVSIGFHVGGPYPLLTLRRDLEEMFDGKTFSLPDECCGIKKPYVKYFQPGRFYSDSRSEGDRMPEALRKTLSDVIITGDNDKGVLGQQLDLWWQEKMHSSTYLGPYPKEAFDELVKKN